MTGFRSDFLRTLEARGFIHQVTDAEGLDALAAKGPVTAYIGYDATADSLHVGHLVQIMMLRWLQKTGGRPIALMGGGTTKIGDPTFRDDARPLLDDATINGNIASLRRVFASFLDFEGGAIMVNNADWLDGLAYIPFLREIGSHFTINRMLSFDSVKLRLEREQPLTFLEFNYMILQGYDFLELSRRHGCVLQMGGSDQWGNIVNGIDLTRRLAGREVYGLTSPLLTTSSGAKMGKTAAGAVWLNEDRLPPYDYWQYWRNTEDADVGRFLKLFTELPLDEIDRLAALGGAEINEAKKILATEATALLHGRDKAEAAAETARQAFEQGVSAEGLPSTEVPRAELAAGIQAFRLFVRAGLAASNGEARRLIQGGGGRVNDAAITDPEQPIGDRDIGADGVIKLSAGRKKHALVRPA
ncbi:tyrosine--tRNA ligase [Inquilinus sp. NPDC058860]|uniref:tyrosine--tRNA ligase n=1 Tax=Inquilinus sp. NPDC058860 TaxID=3346652 RepID=UPI003684B572